VPPTSGYIGFLTYRLTGKPGDRAEGKWSLVFGPWSLIIGLKGQRGKGAKEQRGRGKEEEKKKEDEEERILECGDEGKVFNSLTFELLNF